MTNIFITKNHKKNQYIFTLQFPCLSSGTAPSRNLNNTTNLSIVTAILLLWQCLFWHKLKLIQSFLICKIPFNQATLLMQAGFYGPLLAGLMGFHYVFLSCLNNMKIICFQNMKQSLCRWTINIKLKRKKCIH